MRRTLGVSFVLLSALFLPCAGVAQLTDGDPSRETNGFRLEQNVPNPFEPETWIPFVLSEDLFEEGEPAVVSMSVLNLLQRPISTPLALRHPQGAVPVQELEYDRPGRYVAHWNARDHLGRPVPTGIYLLELNVNGATTMIKMWVSAALSWRTPRGG